MIVLHMPCYHEVHITPTISKCPLQPGCQFLLMLSITAHCCSSPVNQLPYLPKRLTSYGHMWILFISSFSKSSWYTMLEKYECRLRENGKSSSVFEMPTFVTSELRSHVLLTVQQLLLIALTNISIPMKLRRTSGYKKSSITLVYQV